MNANLHYTQVDMQTWYHILAAEINTEYTLTVADLPPSLSTFPSSSFPTSIAFQYTLDGTVTTTIEFTSTSKLMIPKCGKVDFQYWNIAPVFDNGWALLGELNKIITVSETRFTSIANIGTQSFATLRGVPNEVVVVSLFNSQDKKVTAVKCIIGQTGTAQLYFPPGVCV